MTEVSPTYHWALASKPWFLRQQQRIITNYWKSDDRSREYTYRNIKA